MEYKAERIPQKEVEFMRYRVVPNSQVTQDGRFSLNGRFEIETIPDRELTTSMWCEYLLDYDPKQHRLSITSAGGIWLKPVKPIDPTEVVARIPIGSLRRVNPDLSGPRIVGKNGLLVPIETCPILIGDTVIGADEIEDIVVDGNQSLGISAEQIFMQYPLIQVPMFLEGSQVEVVALNRFTGSRPVDDVIVLERGSRRVRRQPYRFSH